jgi:serine/threonine protein kinase
MFCHPDAVTLRKLLDGALEEPEQAEVTRHLDSCQPCRTAMDTLATAGESWSDLPRQLQQPAASAEPALARVMDQLKGGATSVEETQAEDQARAGKELDFLSPSDRPGSLGRLSHYEILEVLGKGGFGLVLKAHDEHLDRIVAIKALAPQLASSGTARKRFKREAKAAAAVCHDHIVGIHAVAEDNGVPYIVMQYVHGVSLQERLDQSGPLELKEILRIGMQAAEGLAAAHKQGLVHRDIKPANILLENGIERVKITDFGLARAVDDASLSQSGVIAGTPMYMAPEQAAAEQVDHRADLFSLGSVLYFMCTGRPPFRASATMAVLKRVIEEDPRPISEVNRDIPEWLCDIVAKLHAKKPADRFQSAREVADLLGQHLAHLQQPTLVPLPAPVTPVPGRAKTRGARWRSIVKRAIVCAAIAPLLYFFGPSWWHFLLNKSLFSFEAGAVGLEKLVLKRDGEIVKTFFPGYAQLTLPPGTYELEAVCQPGMRVSNLVVERKHLFVFEGFTQEMPNNRLTLHLKRGDQIHLTVEMADVEAAPIIESPPWIKPQSTVPLLKAGAAEEGFVSLFNGKDLKGWKPPPGGPAGIWGVKDGAITGTGFFWHLFTERGDFDIFHLRLEAKINEKGIGAVLLPPGKEFPYLHGAYEIVISGDGTNAQIGIKDPKFDRYTGTVLFPAQGYAPLHKVDRQLMKPDEYFTLEIIAAQNRITVLVNGQVAVNGLNATLHKGHLALLIKNPQTVLQVRKVEVKELSPPR